MKKRLIFLLQRQRLFLAMYTERETSGGPRRTDSSGIVMLCVQQVKDSPYYLLYDK